MEKMQKLQMMDKIIRELDDLRSSQTSVLKKVTQIETENISLSLPVLDKELPDIHEVADANLDHLSQVLEKLQVHREEFVKKHKLDVVEA